MNHKVTNSNDEGIFNGSPNNTALFLRNGNRYEKLDLTQLLFIKTAGKYIELQFLNFKRLMRISLVNFFKESSQIELIRIHKGFAVNPDYITAHSSKEITVSEIKIPVGRSYKKNLSDYMARKELAKL